MSFNSKDFKGFTFRSGPVKNTIKQNSHFWMDDDDYDVDEFLGIDTETKKGKDLLERETGERDIKMVDLRSDREFYLQQLGKVFSQKSLKGLSIKELDELLDYTLATGGI